jgi:hypothetical protein
MGLRAGKDCGGETNLASARKRTSILDFLARSLVAIVTHSTNVFWHVDPLLGNNREISSYTTATAK